MWISTIAKTNNNNKNARRRRNRRRDREREHRRAQHRVKRQSVGSKVGSAIGGFLGNAAQNLLGGIFAGRGDYVTAFQEEVGASPENPAIVAEEPEVNSLVMPVGSDKAPQMHMGHEGVCRMIRREFVGDLLSNTDVSDSIVSLRLNPGYPATFPWLSGIAHHFQKYSFLGLVFEYIPTSGYAVSGTPALGYVAGGCQYNGNEPAYSSKVDILQLQGSASGSPATPILWPIECAPDQTVIPLKFVADFGGSTATDRNLRDLGTFTWRVDGTQAGAQAFIVGEIWVSYDVVLMEPRSNVVPALSLTDEEKKVEEILQDYQLTLTRGKEGMEQCTFWGDAEYIEYDAKVRDKEDFLTSPQFKALQRKVRVIRTKRAHEANSSARGSVIPPLPPPAAAALAPTPSGEWQL